MKRWERQYPSSFPSTMPSGNPTKTPTTNPSNVPTLIPSLTPTKTPSNNPSLSPSKAPSRSPTPKPTVPSLLTCGQQVIGDYNDQILEFNVRVPYAGDLVFDASSSSIAIQSLTAVFGVTPIGADTDNDGILTVSVAIPADYTFTLRAPNGVYGTFDVRISCQSDQPTRSPSKYPTAKPTALPTKAPSKRPTDAPIKPGSPTRSPTRPSLTPTMNPAFTASPSRFPSTVPSVFPTRFPTKIPSNNPTKTPTRTPTQVPSKIPTKTPTVTPTETPSDNPTHVPSLGPTKKLREGEVFVSTRGAEITKSSEDDGHDSWEDDAQTDDAFLTIAAVLVGCIILVLIFAICWRLKLIKFTPSPEAYKIEMDSKTMGTKRRLSRVGSVSHVSEERKEYVDDPEDTVDVETQDADDKPGMDQETDDISVDMETQGMDEEQKAVKDWLIGFKMERYYDLLMENGMTSLEYIERIETTQDLYHIGVMLKGHQIVIMSEITKLIMTETPGDVDVDLIFNGEAAGGGEGECTTGFETAGNIKND